MKTTSRRGKWRIIGLIFVIVIGSYLTWALKRALPDLQPRPVAGQFHQSAEFSTLSWPTAAQASQSAVGVVGTDILETHGKQTPVPIASTAKVLTALVVLNKIPLPLGQPGPTITLTDKDVALYAAYHAGNGSVIPVQPGEQINQYQMLQAIMLPSANNIADTLAIWAFGSLQAYGDAAKQYLKQHGLNATTVGSDASGLSPTTTSTAHDLVRLGELAMQNPVLASIVGQATASGIPLTTEVKNVNFLLGTDNIVGVKTGNTDEAGGVFIAAARTTVNYKPVTIVTALAGAPSIFAALKYSQPLIHTAQTNFQSVTVVKAGTVVGHYVQSWGDTINAVTKADLAGTAWRGTIITASNDLKPVTVIDNSPQTAGRLTVNKPLFGDSENIPVVLDKAATHPSIWWRLSHPL